MGKRRQGPINKKVDFLPNKLNKYSIRKFTVGTASILLGSTLIFGSSSHEAKAAEEKQVDPITQANQNDSSERRQKKEAMQKQLNLSQRRQKKEAT